MHQRLFPRHKPRYFLEILRIAEQIIKRFRQGPQRIFEIVLNQIMLLVNKQNDEKKFNPIHCHDLFNQVQPDHAKEGSSKKNNSQIKVY